MAAEIPKQITHRDIEGPRGASLDTSLPQQGIIFPNRDSQQGRASTFETPARVPHWKNFPGETRQQKEAALKAYLKSRVAEAKAKYGPNVEVVF